MAEFIEHNVYPGIYPFYLLVPSHRIRQVPQPEFDAGQNCVNLKQSDTTIIVFVARLLKIFKR